MNMMIDDMRNRHAVRSYRDDAVEIDKLDVLKDALCECNKVPELNFQMITDEPNAFDGFMAHYGKFSGVRNYIGLIAKKGSDEKVGYYGEKIVLLAQSLGLNTCWVAMTFNKKKTPFKIESGEKFYIAIPFGYGTTQGVAHKSKTLEELSETNGAIPDWFRSGMEAVILAPTAMNQQKFCFKLENGVVTAEKKFGPCSVIDLGIVKYHFEIGSGKEGYFKI